MSEDAERNAFEGLPEFVADHALLQRQWDGKSYVYTRVQGMWDGWRAKAAQAETAQAAPAWCQCPACAPVLHASDCSVHNAPALPVGSCDCGAAPGLVPLPATATKEMRVAAVKFANGDAVYKNVTAGALEIEEQIYGEIWEAMVAATPGATHGN